MLLLHTSDARSTQCRFQDHQTSFFAGRFFVVQHINFDTAPWPVNTALFWIFLSDNKEMRQQRQLRNEQYDSISEWLNAAQSEERNKITLPSTTFEKLESVRKKIPKVSAASPLLWIRFAFGALRDGNTPSSYFFRMYANWRFSQSRRYGTQTISRIHRVDEKSSPHSSRVEDEEIQGFLFDQFFLEKRPISEAEWKSEWELLLVQNLPKTKATKVDIREHVGRKVFQRLEECITLAAKEERIEGLSKQRKNQKYTANISRAELADKLQRRYGKRLACQTSTIIRALSELVTCRKRSN
jgi:hypothetical protein